MSVLWTQTWTANEFGREVVSICSFDGLLWILTDEPNPNLAQAWDIRIYYSQDGENFTEDTDWDIEGMSVLARGGQLFVHQDLLYLLCNKVSTPGNLSPQNGYIYRKQNGEWVEVCSEASTDYHYLRAHSNDSWIVVAGYRSVAGPDSATIWKWNGSTKTLEYESSEYQQRAQDITYYANGVWYALLGFTSSITVLYRSGGGTWLYVNSDGDAGGKRFLSSRHGLFAGGLLWKTSGEWVDTAWPTVDTKVPLYEFGGVIGNDAQESDWGDQGETYVWYNGQWEYIGKPGYRDHVWEYDAFQNVLYGGGFDSTSGPTVWRLEPEDETTPGPWAQSTARAIVCDHQYGDTLYLGVYDGSGHPFMMALDEEFDWWETIFAPSSGSYVGVQTAGVRNIAYAFGYFGQDEQIRITEDGGLTTSDADDNWGTDKATSLEYHTTSGSNLITTIYADQNLLQTTTGREPWSKIDDIPILPRCQLRVIDDVWVGSDTNVAAPVRMYSSGSWADKSNGLPAIAINDLELGF